MQQQAPSLEEYIAASQGDIDVIKRIDLSVPEPIYKQNVLHLLLRNYIALMGEQEKNETWLEKLRHRDQAIKLILSSHPELVNDTDKMGQTPIRVMSSWCPVFSGKLPHDRNYIEGSKQIMSTLVDLTKIHKGSDILSAVEEMQCKLQL